MSQVIVTRSDEGEHLRTAVLLRWLTRVSDNDAAISSVLREAKRG
jgi:hypothetical protein